MVFASLTASGQNLLSNGNFDGGNTGFSTDYFFSPGDTRANSTYDVVRNPHDSHPLAGSFADHTSGTGLMLVANGSTNGARAVWRQTVHVVPHSDYYFSGWACSWARGWRNGKPAELDPCPSQICVWINGLPCGALAQVPASTGHWTSFGAAWTASDSSTALLEIRLATTQMRGNDVAIDDLDFRALPASPTQTAQVSQPRESAPATTPPPAAAETVYTVTTGVTETQIFRAVEIAWPSVAGAQYQVQWADDAGTSAWSSLGSLVTGNGGTNSVFDRSEGHDRRFYRVLSVK